MATHTFTFKVPDLQHVNSWEDGRTATGTLKMDDASVKLWFHQGDMDPAPSLFASSFNEGYDSIGVFPPVTQQELTEVTLSPDNDKNKMFLWLAKHESVGELFDSDEWPEEVRVDTQIPNRPDGVTWKKLSDASWSPRWAWKLCMKDGQVDAIFKADENLTISDMNAYKRKHNVKFYRDNYDLGTAADSDADAFMAACDQFITDNADVYAWMLTPEALVHETGLAPRIPLSVATAINNIPEGDGMEFAYTPWENTAEAQKFTDYPDLVYLSDLD